MNLTYAPWQPQAGMKRTFEDLSRAYGDPNSGTHQWPAAVLAVVCERGAPVELRWDKHAADSHYWFTSAPVTA